MIKYYFKTGKMYCFLMAIISVFMFSGCDNRSECNKFITFPGENIKIKINYPSENGTVSFTEIVKGENKITLTDNQKIWVIVFPLLANKYYPQKEVDLQENGIWSTVAYFGMIDRGVGEKFKVIVALVDSDANNILEDYMTNAKKNNKWDGMDDLPKGTKTYDAVTVERIR